ncbi:MAG TPA: metallophosphoesterase [Acidimicrobiia bacterium]|nr:metallophosphoesterase [Acidimicrobiia bacterium]
MPGAEPREPELFTVAPDEVVITCTTDVEREVVVRVGDHEATSHGRLHVLRVTGLEPATTYPLDLDGVAPSALLPATVTTLAEPPGRHVGTVATVNDVHFGERECGKLGTPEEIGPVFSVAPGEEPYPDVMNRGAIAEMRALDPDAIVVKGDLTDRGTDEEYEQFLAAYSSLGARMHHVRGNHDASISSVLASEHAPFTVDVAGARLAVIDTTVPRLERGHVPDAQLEWLDAVASDTSGAVLVFGHHHPWEPGSPTRSETYFGINPDDSEALCAVFARHDNIVGYFAGHTHRNRVRRFPAARGIPIVEVACVKDYPGAWAEYRLHEGGYTQIVRRIGSPDAMTWTEQTRHMFAGTYRDYALGALDERCFTVSY